MNNIKLMTQMIVFLTIFCIPILIVGCSDDEQPESLQFSIKIQDGKLVSGSETFKAKQGDTVSFNIESDKDGTIHLHGYDIKVSVDPIKSSDMMLVADSTGSFKIAMHPGSDMHHDNHNSEKDSEHKHDKTDSHDIHGSLFESELLETGDEFSFSFGEDLTGKMIKFHNHMNHEKEGSIMVNSDSENSGFFQIQVNESGFIPVKISVKPGTNVTWSNSGTKRAKIVSGPPPKIPGDHAHEEDAEIILGSLEIYPR
tara:strand:+ start:6198 stop:6962 length:765 start_codon:yes stop_codon:yes gene_type:complete